LDPVKKRKLEVKAIEAPLDGRKKKKENNKIK
jgi:hypothetical protein